MGWTITLAGGGGFLLWLEGQPWYGWATVALLALSVVVAVLREMFARYADAKHERDEIVKREEAMRSTRSLLEDCLRDLRAIDVADSDHAETHAALLRIQTRVVKCMAAATDRGEVEPLIFRYDLANARQSWKTMVLRLEGLYGNEINSIAEIQAERPQAFGVPIPRDKNGNSHKWYNIPEDPNHTRSWRDHAIQIVECILRHYFQAAPQP